MSTAYIGLDLHRTLIQVVEEDVGIEDVIQIAELQNARRCTSALGIFAESRVYAR
jgi:hypothetical protein